MKKICTKILLSVLVVLCITSTASLYIPVKAAGDDGISPQSTYKDAFNFKGSCGISRAFDKTKLKVEVNGHAANENNETITLKIYIASRNTTVTKTFLTDQNSHIYDNISLGDNGSDVGFTFTGANPEITINMYFYTISHY